MCGCSTGTSKGMESIFIQSKKKGIVMIDQICISIQDFCIGVIVVPASLLMVVIILWIVARVLWYKGK